MLKISLPICFRPSWRLAWGVVPVGLCLKPGSETCGWKDIGHGTSACAAVGSKARLSPKDRRRRSFTSKQQQSSKANASRLPVFWPLFVSPPAGFRMPLQPQRQGPARSSGPSCNQPLGLWGGPKQLPTGGPWPCILQRLHLRPARRLFWKIWRPLSFGSSAWDCRAARCHAGESKRTHGAAVKPGS